MRLGNILITYNNGSGSRVYDYSNGTSPKLNPDPDNFLDICLSSYFDSVEGDCPFVVIDDGSTDNSVDIISKYEDRITRFIKKDSNEGLTKGMNEAADILIDEFGCDAICRFDADIEFISQRWDTLFLDYFAKNREVGALGACQITPYGGIWALGDMLVHPKGYTHILGYFNQFVEGKPISPILVSPHLRLGNFECDSVMGCLAAFRTSAYRRVDGLRREFETLRGETEDLNLRIMLEGYKCIALGSILFIHRHVEHGTKNATYDDEVKYKQAEDAWIELWGWDKMRPDFKAIYDRWKDTPIARNLLANQDGSVSYIGPY